MQNQAQKQMGDGQIVLGEQVIYKYTPNFVCPECGEKVFYHFLIEKQDHIKFCRGKN